MLDFVDAGPHDVAGDRNELRARALRGADLAERFRAHADDHGDVRQRLDVVHHRRPQVQAFHRQARRAVARVALLAFDRRQQAGRLAAHVRTRALDDDEIHHELGAVERPAEVAGRIRLLDRGLQAAIRQVELAAHVDERVAHAERVAGDQHRLDQLVRVVLEDPAILERAGLAFVGVRAQEVRLAVVGLDHGPLAADREGGAAVAEDARGGDFLRHVDGLHGGQGLLERSVAAARAIVGQQVGRRRHGEGHQERSAGHGRGPLSSAGRAARRASRSKGSRDRPR